LQNIIFGELRLFDSVFNVTEFKIHYVFQFVKESLKTISGHDFLSSKSFFDGKTDQDIILHPCLYLYHCERKEFLIKIDGFLIVSSLKYDFLLF
jgi:hypothetical protein